MLSCAFHRIALFHASWYKTRTVYLSFMNLHQQFLQEHAQVSYTRFLYKFSFLNVFHGHNSYKETMRGEAQNWKWVTGSADWVRPGHRSVTLTQSGRFTGRS